MINLIVILAFLLWPPVNGFNPVSGQIDCRSREICLHEVGHLVDERAGWVSLGREWRQAVDAYRYMTWKYPEMRDALSEDIALFPTTGWTGYTELYADIVRMADGRAEKIPPALRGFYELGTVNETMEGLWPANNN